MSNISLATVVSKRKDQLLVSELGNELVMMDIENGNYIGLNETGKIIWELIESPTRVEDVVAILLEKYDTSKEECASDTLEYLNKMNDQKILIVEHQP